MGRKRETGESCKRVIVMEHKSEPGKKRSDHMSYWIDSVKVVGVMH